VRPSIVGSVLMTCLIFPACGGGQARTDRDPDAADTREPWLRGTVVSIDVGEYGKSVLLVDVPVGGCRGEAFLFISSTTRVRARTATGTTSASIDDVVVGQRLKAWLRGTVAESCPPRMSAEAVVIWERSACRSRSGPGCGRAAAG
jgi:hypothetical protein